MNAFVQPLEARRLFAADLGVSVKSTTFPSQVVLGAAVKPTVALLNLTNAGDALAKTDADVTLTVNLEGGANPVTLGTSTVKASGLTQLKSTPTKAFPVKLAVPANLPAGSYTLTARVSTAAGETATANNTDPDKAVTVAAGNQDVAVSVQSDVSGSVANGTKGVVTVNITNGGNLPVKARGTVQLFSSVNGAAATALGPAVNVSLNLLPNSAKPFSAKVPVTLAGTGTTNANVVLSARFTPAATLTGDNTANNTATLATLTVTPPPPSALGSQGFGDTFTFKTTFTQTAPAVLGFSSVTVQSGTWRDSNGRTGRFYYTSGGNAASNGACQLQNDGGAVVATFKLLAPTETAIRAPRISKITFLATSAGATGPAFFGKSLFFKVG